MSKRLSYVDSVKGIGIILVMLGHVYQVPTPIHDIIYGFHMPLFFVLSGYVYHHARYSGETLGAYIKKRAKNYLLPYYLFAFINLVLVIMWRTLLMDQSVTARQIGSYLAGILYCRSDMVHMPNCTPIWFLMSLFFASILLRELLNRLEERSRIGALVCMALGYALSLLTDVPFPLKLDTVFMAVFFMYIGYRLRQTDALNAPLPAAAIGLAGMLAGYFNPVAMNENEYGDLLLLLFSSLTVSWSLLLLCAKTRLGNARILGLLGRHSILIVGFNYFLRDVAVEVYYLIPIVKNTPIAWFSSFLITLVLALLLVWAWDLLQRKKGNRNTVTR